jgi:short-subunit dehydrogenase
LERRKCAWPAGRCRGHRLNVESTVHLSKRVVQHMVKRGTGEILITS